MSGVDNPFPSVLSRSAADSPPPLLSPRLDELRDELYSLIRRIQDPEHQLTLAELGVVSKRHISFHSLRDGKQRALQPEEAAAAAAGDAAGEEADDAVVAVVEFTPTVPHCSLATTIGLCIRARLSRAMPDLKLDVRVRQGTHNTAEESRTQHTHAPSQ